MGDGPRGFPLTRWSALRAIVDSDPDARRQGGEVFARAYWKPLFVYVRLKHRLSAEDAQDTTQAFLETLWTSDMLASFDPVRARLRTFLRVCLDRFVSNERRAARAQRRGGERQHLSVDAEALDRMLAQEDRGGIDDPDERFEREWVRSIYEISLEATRRRYAEQQQARDFEMFERYSLGEEKLGYAELAALYQLPVTTVTNRLAAVRRQLRTAMLAQLRELTLDDGDFAADVAQVFGNGAR